MWKILAVTMVVALYGCAYPISSDQQGAPGGQLYFPAAHQGERVAIDGADAGSTSEYTGNQTVAVTTGLHRVVVSSDGKILLDKKVYVGAGAKVAIGNY